MQAQRLLGARLDAGAATGAARDRERDPDPPVDVIGKQCLATRDADLVLVIAASLVGVDQQATRQ